MKNLVYLLAVLTLFANTAFAQPEYRYREEIMIHIVDPCYKQRALASDLQKHMSVEEAVSLMKMLANNAIENTVRTISPMVARLGFEQRMTIYGMGLRICLKAGSRPRK